MVAPLLQHIVDLDISGGGTIEGDGTVGALAGHTVGSLRGTTVGNLRFVVSSETVSAAVLYEPGPAAERGRDRTAPDAPPLANELVYSLDNRNQRALGVGSPIQPGVQVGRATRWRIRSGGTVYPVCQGAIKEGIADTSFGAERVGLRALSQLSQLVGKTGYTSRIYGDGTATGLYTNEALRVVLEVAGLGDPARRAFDHGDTGLLWFWISPSDDLFDLALAIWAAEGPGARLYDDADGVTTFKRRTSELIEPRFTTSQATFRDTDDGVSAWYAAWTPTSGERLMVNRATYPIVSRAPGAEEVIARAGAVVALGPNAVVDVPLTAAQDEPIYSVISPDAPTDYTVTAGALASIGFVGETSGMVVVLRLVAGAGGATVEGPSSDRANGLQLRGRLLRVIARVSAVDRGVDTAASIAEHGVHGFTVGGWPVVARLEADALCNQHVLRGMTPRPTATISAPLAQSRNVLAALPRQIGDRITVLNDRALFARTMWVEAVRVVGGGGGTVVELFAQSTYAAAGAGSGGWSVGLWSQATWGT